MKRVFALILLFALTLPILCGCASSLEGPAGTEENGTASQSQNQTKGETGEIVYPDTFSVGYASVDVSGTPPIDYFAGVAKSVHDPLMLTCIAVWDGENAALLMTGDLQKMHESVAQKTLEIIEKNFGIPADRVILTCTHSHAAISVGFGTVGHSNWLQQYYKKLKTVINQALADLDPVEGAYTGKANTEHPIAFVRRYLLADGTYKMNPSRSDNAIAHETEADPEFRTVRFDRKNKKDVLMVNFQTHYGGAPDKYPEQLSADFVHLFRKNAKKEFNCEFAYYAGAGANINFLSIIPGERYYSDYELAVDGFMETTEACLKAEEKAAVGSIVSSRSLFPCTTRRDSAELVAKAREVASAGYDETEAGVALIKEYGFGNKYDASFVLSRSTMPDTQEVPVNAISFGDFAFVGAPYEMFDTNGKEIRDASPYKTTFICTLSLGAFNYVPSQLAFEHGGYETYVCRFVAGTGEALAQEMVRLLNANKNGA